MKRKRTSSKKSRAQLDGALALFGVNNDVAGYNNVAFVQRAGELIVRAASSAKPFPPKPKIKPGYHA